MDGGGSIYRYKINLRAEVKNIVINAVSSWAELLVQELEKWGVGDDIMMQNQYKYKYNYF